jgi:putative methyltransferase (TIGR04325 family)
LNWEGVYPHYRDVPAYGPGFDDEVWAADTRRLTEQARASSGKGLPPVAGDQVLLPLLGAIAAGNGGHLKVLDFGGGMGISFVHLAATAPHAEHVEYHVIETPRVCEEGARLFADDARIRFHRALPDTFPGLDIAYLNSSLQYVEDYRELLEKLCAFAPRFILLARCAAGENPTFATAQVTLPGKRIPYWFINVRELVSILEQCDYSLLFRARAATGLDLSNFPERYRQGTACNLLFARTGQQ